MTVRVGEGLGIHKTSAVAAACLVVMSVLAGCGGPGLVNTSDRTNGLTPPMLAAISPPSGPTTGGTMVTITGAEFQAGATIHFGDAAATSVTVISATQIQAAAPAHTAGSVNVVVTNPDGPSVTRTDAFTYTVPQPAIGSVAPNSGPAAGGTVVAIIGTNFQSGATVTFGGMHAATVTLADDTQINATTPAHGVGTVDVTVKNPDGGNTTAASGFTFGVVTVGCGTGTDNSDCGNVGDPYEGGSPPGGTALSACLDSLTADTAYYLTQDVGSDPEATCFGLRKGVTLDLRGHTITGRLDLPWNPSGVTIFNGTVNCEAYPLPAACIRVSGSESYTAKARLHHLTVHNSANPGTEGLAAIYIDWSGLDGANLAIEVDHITGYVQSAPYSNRAILLRVSTGKKADIHHNDLTCNADVKACNLIEAVPIEGYVNGIIRNNKLTIAANTVAGGLPRAICISGPDSGSTGTQGWKVHGNVCTANNGRCFRFRQVNDLEVYNNTVLNCASTMGYGCYHFADPSNGETYVSDAAANIHDETITLDTGGVGFWLRDGNGWTVRDIRVVGTRGKLGRLDTPLQTAPGGPIPTSAAFCNITGAAALDADSNVQADTTVNVFNAGSWTGTGTINVLSSCP